jgi:hypothetical protein
MHATKERKKSDKEGYKIATQVRQGGAVHIQTIIMMAARSNRIGDERRKLRQRDDRRMRD